MALKSFIKPAASVPSAKPSSEAPTVRGNDVFFRQQNETPCIHLSKDVRASLQNKCIELINWCNNDAPGHLAIQPYIKQLTIAKGFLNKCNVLKANFEAVINIIDDTERTKRIVEK